MNSARRIKEWILLGLAAALLAVGWMTTALAQSTGGDGDGADGDELSAVALLLAVAAIAVVSWVVYSRRSTKPR